MCIKRLGMFREIFGNVEKNILYSLCSIFMGKQSRYVSHNNGNEQYFEVMLSVDPSKLQIIEKLGVCRINDFETR